MARASLARKQRERAKTVGRTPGEWQEKPIGQELIDEFPQLRHCKHIWFNNRVEVQVYECRSTIGGIVQLMIRRHFDLEELSWSEIQRIVRQLFGDVMALEMYPPASVEWHTEANVRVVWVMPLDWVSPFGLHRPEAFGNSSIG
jgi:hypothetical protein